MVSMNLYLGLANVSMTITDGAFEFIIHHQMLLNDSSRQINTFKDISLLKKINIKCCVEITLQHRMNQMCSDLLS